MSLITQEQPITQNENINQNSLISDNNIEKTEQKLTESKIIEDKEITLPNSSDKKNSSNKIMQRPNLNNFIKTETVYTQPRLSFIQNIVLWSQCIRTHVYKKAINI